MTQRRSINSNSLQRNHNFINRAQFSVINVCGKQNWQEVLHAIKKNTKFQNQCENKMQVKKQTRSSVQYLKIQECLLGAKKYYSGKTENEKEQSKLVIPSWIQEKIFNNLIKLVIVNCGVSNILFQAEPDKTFVNELFPNLQQLDLSNNYLQEIPKFIYDCSKLQVIKLSKNKITRLQSSLASMQKMYSISLFQNYIQQISMRALTHFQQNKISLELEWSPKILIQCLKISNEIVAGQIMESVRTEGDYEPMDQNQSMIMPSDRVQNLKKQDKYMKISDSLKTIMQFEEKYDQIIQNQVERLIYYDCHEYLIYFSSHLAKNFTYYINLSFGHKKYRALDYILKLLQKNRMDIQNLGQNHRKQDTKNEKMQKRQKNLYKLNHKFSSSSIGNRTIEVSQQQKICSISSRKSVQNLAIEKICNDKQNEQFVIEKLVTFKIHHYNSIPLQSIDSINLQKFLWLINQLENINFCKQDYKEILTSFHFHLLINKFMGSDLDLETIANSSNSKAGIKLLLKFSDIQFFNSYHFQSVSILKILLSFDDFQLFYRFEKQYPRFIEALFKNNVRPISLAISEKVSEISQVNAKQTIFQDARQGTFWKYIVRPNSKLYKVLYKKYKLYVKEHCAVDYHKSWHFPEYIAPQTMVVRNDVHDYEILKDYEQFQASFYHKDLKVHVRKPSERYQYSIAKKIYMQLYEKTSSMIRNIGKTKDKNGKIFKEINYNSILSSVPASFDNSMIKQQQSAREKHNFSCATPDHNYQQASQKKKGEGENIKKQRIKSIKCISGRKKVAKKKNGISLFSNSQQRQNKENINKRTPNQIKYCYLDLSNRNRISVESLLNYNKGNVQGNQDVVECSTFDLN